MGFLNRIFFAGTLVFFRPANSAASEADILLIDCGENYTLPDSNLVNHQESNIEKLNRKYDEIFREIKNNSVDGDKIIAELTENANLGHGGSMHTIGAIYESGILVPIDLEKAEMWYKSANKIGIAQSQFRLGEIYSRRGSTNSRQLAEEYYLKAAAQGYAPAKLALGRSLIKSRNSNKLNGFNYIKAAAEDGYIPAYSFLSSLYFKGEGTERNFDLAFYWASKAAPYDEPVAQLILGAIYDLGLGKQKDLRQAYAWYRLAQELGDKQVIEPLSEIQDMLSNEDKSLAENLVKEKLRSISSNETEFKQYICSHGYSRW